MNKNIIINLLSIIIVAFSFLEVFLFNLLNEKVRNFVLLPLLIINLLFQMYQWWKQDNTTVK